MDEERLLRQGSERGRLEGNREDRQQRSVRCAAVQDGPEAGSLPEGDGGEGS